MSQAFEITVEDVVCVLENHGKNVTDEKAMELFSQLDLASVEDAALYELEMEEQIDSAYKEIALQLKEQIELLT